jgi:5-methylthioadenosine/S-adenosylhomocysteine deaminase
MTDSPAHPPLQAADTLVHARWLLPMDERNSVLEAHSVALAGKRILAIGPTVELTEQYQGAREYRLDSHAVLPGLINAHGHSPMTLLRGFADDLPLQPWLEQHIWPAEGRWMSEDFVTDGARLAIAEMLLSGTTFFSDMYFFPEEVARAAVEAGIRVQLTSPIFDFPTVWAGSAEEYIAKGTRLLDDYRASELVRVAFGPHAPYTVSDAPLRKIAMLAEELDLNIHMHIHENAQEIHDALQLTGMRPLTRLKQLELLSPRLQGVHMTQLLDSEIELLAANGVHVVHCPASNLKLASGSCRVSALLAAGVNVALGTDGCASNNDLDLFRELRLAALLGKGTTGDASALNAPTALRMATVNGAKLLGMDDQLGTLTAGKLADLIAVDLDHANTQPVYDPLSTLVYSANSRQVSHVWINGQLLVEQGRLTRMQLPQLLTQARQWGARIKRGTA